MKEFKEGDLIISLESEFVYKFKTYNKQGLIIIKYNDGSTATMGHLNFRLANSEETVEYIARRLKG